MKTNTWYRRHFPLPDGPALWVGTLLALILLMSACGNGNEASEAASASTVDTLSAQEHTQLGLQSLYGKWDYAEAKKHFERALELNPDLAPAHAHYAWYLELEDRYPEAIEHIKRARDLQPDNAVFQAWTGWICFDANDMECAEEELKKALEMNPNLPGPKQILGLLEEKRGNSDEAAEWFMRLGQDSAKVIAKAFAFALRGQENQAREVIDEVVSWNSPNQNIDLAIAHMRLGDHDDAIGYLQKAYDSHHEYMPWVRIIDAFASIKEDPRFQDIIGKVGWPEEGS